MYALMMFSNALWMITTELNVSKLWQIVCKIVKFFTLVNFLFFFCVNPNSVIYFVFS
jgi:hypothetical protein